METKVPESQSVSSDNQLDTVLPSLGDLPIGTAPEIQSLFDLEELLQLGDDIQTPLDKDVALSGDITQMEHYTSVPSCSFSLSSENSSGLDSSSCSPSLMPVEMDFFPGHYCLFDPMDFNEIHSQFTY